MDSKKQIDALIIDGSDGGALANIEDPILDGADRYERNVITSSISETNVVGRPQLYKAPRPSVLAGNAVFHGTTANATVKNIRMFLRRYSPSRTPLAPDCFICVTNFKDPQLRLGLNESNMKAMMESFNFLIESENVTPESVDIISRKHKVLSGKWVIFVPVGKVDALWTKVVNLVCVEGKAECANVRNDPEFVSGRSWNHQVICVWVKDYTDKRSVVELRMDLRRIGVRQEILFKTDAYSYLDIYTNNPWNMRPGIVYG